VLATARSAGASYVVSGDRELQRLSEFQGIRIISARQFLDVLDAEERNALSGEPE
jgi:hypothetical protein